ncbi:hypothetical protein PACILC2_00840 [Paenibacillus cisolokensis]|uniref:Uncharacterized protein n=1 Tax=Paenibacillus cisolokensis TaxID=1658519 RepID=A0ABQ4N020_9BACL|nr:hypothetical protein PACILC2_00840 [Paenibacillus cisolokensis]
MQTAPIITYEESVRLTQEILSQPPGDWTHKLDGVPVREVARLIVGSHGHVIVFFRGPDYCGRWPADQFDAQAITFVPEPEQLTLF